MNAAAETVVQKWTWMRWLAVIAIVFVAHVALIFIFGTHKPITPMEMKNVPSLTLAGKPAEDWLGLKNATLFALPSANGFAELMWMTIAPPGFHKQDWTEPPRWLALPAAELGSTFNHFVQTNQFAEIHLEYNLPPPLAAPVIPPQPPLAQASTLQIEGQITSRGLLTTTKLPSWPFDDAIAPSVVQVVVNAGGDVVSAVLLPPENTLEPSAVHDPDADEYAVEQARAARFAPLPSGAGGVESSPAGPLAFGKLIFNWQAVPVTTKK
jgi:hypothetical protein